jgi:putative ATPase
MNLFGNEPQKNIKKVAKNAPLADRMRPEKLKDIVGQDEIIGPGKILCAAIERDEVPSMIFWGPPGCGKTSLARVIARTTKSVFVNFSAASGNIKEVREIIRLGEERQKREGVRTILFVDEIHRFNKANRTLFCLTSRTERLF